MAPDSSTTCPECGRRMYASRGSDTLTCSCCGHTSTVAEVLRWASEQRDMLLRQQRQELHDREVLGL